MKLYHAVKSDMVASVRENGLKRISRGDKGGDKSIIRADQYLDERRPKKLKAAGLSRDDNLYAYYAVDGEIIDITDGKQIPLQQFISRESQKLQRIIEIDVNPADCYVSDLDTYDSLKSALEDHESNNLCEKIAKSYWDKITPLQNFEFSNIRRPEVMITVDIEPRKLDIASA